MILIMVPIHTKIHCMYIDLDILFVFCHCFDVRVKLNLAEFPLSSRLSVHLGTGLPYLQPGSGGVWGESVLPAPPAAFR